MFICSINKKGCPKNETVGCLNLHKSHISIKHVSHKTIMGNGIRFTLLLISIVYLNSLECARIEMPHQKAHHLEGCSKCIPGNCPKSDEECQIRGRLVQDLCGCCSQGVCGLQEGEKCYNASLSPPLPQEYRKYGMCGESLECQLRVDLTERDEPEALCVCQETQEACGSDGKTYESVCQMGQEATRFGGSALYLRHWGPCASVPWIITAPVDSASMLHNGLALDCEVKGFPIPSIHWEFAGDDGSRRTLPSDDLSVAVQVRGGPEPYMVTSWLQIVDLRHTDMGTYTCVATNKEGAATASAMVGIRG